MTAKDYLDIDGFEVVPEIHRSYTVLDELIKP
jgi:hypothetical protein